MKYTIEDIATAAGVSKATVSRVINGTATVSHDVKKRVNDAVDKFDYRPNINARRLAGGVGGLIALVLEESTEEFFGNPYWRAVVDGFVTEVSKNGQHPVLYFHSKDDTERELVDVLMRGNYDAVAVFGWRRDIKTLERHIPKDMRIVFGGRQGESARFTYVGADNFAGAKIATSHLIERGCKNILTITGNLSVESGRERLAGYKSALAAAGMQVKSQNIIEGNYSRDSAKKSMTKLLRKEDNFDGVFAANDQMAMGAIDVLTENRIQVPEDVKVIGFDGIEQAASFNPPISTIAQPSYELGARVASQLTLPRTETLQNIELALELIVRKSTAK
jgi:DNA-binding LacI/PurR family transcriptional regulator